MDGRATIARRLNVKMDAIQSMESATIHGNAIVELDGVANSAINVNRIRDVSTATATVPHGSAFVIPIGVASSAIRI